MIKYLTKILEDFLENITKSSVTPAADYLFRIRDDEEVKKLPEELAIAFHHTVAQLLFLSQRARRDVQLPVSCLTKRVQSPNRDDLNKLVRCLQYLKATLHMKLTLKVDSMNIMNWFIYSSHQIHEDCKGHTGAALTLGKGAVLSKAGGQKGNTKSTAETELQGVSDYLPTVLWGKYCVEAQGYTIEHNVIHASTLRLLINGKKSSTPRTKHIKAHFFLAKDKYDQGEIEFKKCHTAKMWVDMNTQPKQGAPFRKDRSMMMNVPEDCDDDIEKANTHPDLLPKPADQLPFIQHFPTIDRPKPVNRRRSVLGRNKPKTAIGPSPVKSNLNTAGTISPITNSNRVSWADMVRRNPKHEPSVHEPIRDRFFDTIGRYATIINKL